MGPPTLPNGQPVNFGFGNKSNNKAHSKRKPQANQTESTSAKSSSTRKNKSSNSEAVGNSKANSTKSLKKQNHQKSNSQNVNPKERKTDGQHESKDGISYAGSSFHVAQPKLSDLPKPSFACKPANKPVSSTKLTMDQLFNSNTNNIADSPVQTASISAPSSYPGPNDSYPQPSNYNYQQYPSPAPVPPHFMAPYPVAAVPNGGYYPNFNQLPSYLPQAPHPVYQQGMPMPPQGAGLPNVNYYNNMGHAYMGPAPAPPAMPNTDNGNQEIVSELKKQLHIG